MWGSLRAIAGITLVSTTLACSIDKAGFGMSKDPSQFFARFEFTQHALNLATDSPYNTEQVHVIAEMQDGSPVSAPVTFTVRDSTRVKISPTGVLTALAPTSRTVILASSTYEGFTRTDSAIVSVINGTPSSPLHRLSIVPQTGDSAKVNPSGATGGGSKTLKLLRLNPAGDTLSSVLVALRSSDTLTAAVSQSANNIVVRAKRPGRVMLYVSSLAYGVEKQDSLPFVVGWPLGVYIALWSRTPTGSSEPILDFNPGTITVGVGACVIWWNGQKDREIDVVFDDPSSAGEPTAGTTCANVFNTRGGSGNIPAYKPDFLPNGNIMFTSQFSSRVFTQPGEYHYRSTLYGTKGVIKVCDEQQDRLCAPDRSKW